MRKKKEKRTAVLPVVRISLKEKKAIRQAYLSSSFPTQSAFLRYKILSNELEKDSSDALKMELKMADTLDGLQKMEANILEIVKERKLKKERAKDKKELLKYASLIKMVRELQQKITLNDIQ